LKLGHIPEEQCVCVCVCVSKQLTQGEDHVCSGAFITHLISSHLISSNVDFI